MEALGGGENPAPEAPEGEADNGGLAEGIEEAAVDEGEAGEEADDDGYAGKFDGGHGADNEQAPEGGEPEVEGVAEGAKVVEELGIVAELDQARGEPGGEGGGFRGL